LQRKKILKYQFIFGGDYGSKDGDMKDVSILKSILIFPGVKLSMPYKKYQIE